VAHLAVMTSQGPDGMRVTVRGELDLSTAGRLEEALRLAEARADGQLRLDYSGLEFIDSTGLQVLLDADHRAAAVGRRLVVVLGTGEARRVAELADAVGRLTVSDVVTGA
jgi:anti-sigma B factor antagonist